MTMFGRAIAVLLTGLSFVSLSWPTVSGAAESKVHSHTLFDQLYGS